MKFTKGPWEYRHIPGGEEGIFAQLKVREGKTALCKIFEIPQKPILETTHLRDDGILEIEVAYSAWYQFEVCDFNKEQWKANAQLIASAPSLLEALKEILGDYDIEITGCFQCRWCGREYSGMMGDDEIPELCPSDDCPGHVARQAIAKATGT